MVMAFYVFFLGPGISSRQVHPNLARFGVWLLAGSLTIPTKIFAYSWAGRTDPDRVNAELLMDRPLVLGAVSLCASLRLAR